MHLDPTSGVPFYRQVEAHLAEQIRTAALAPGALLPSARALAAELLVSVITVKQAYEALEAAGLVYSQQGRGTFVAPAGADAARRQVREALRDAVALALDLARSRGLPEPELRDLVLSLLDTPPQERP